MRARSTLCFFSFCLLSGVAFAQEGEVSPDPNAIAADIGSAVLQGFVDPVLGALSETSATLASSMDELCQAPSAQALQAARDAFAETVPAWGYVSVLRFGPLVRENRFERIFFWPDPRGVTLRQVQGLLASDAPLSEDVAGQSVALQGLPALEYVLYGTGSQALAEEGQDERRCSYGASIASNVLAIVDTLVEGWGEGTPFHKAFTAPAPGLDPYRSNEEVAAEIVKAAGTALQFVRNAELLPALGDAPEKAQGRRAPFWRSGQSFAFAAAQLDGVDQLVHAAGFVDGTSDLVNGYGRAMVFDVSHARDALASVEAEPEQAFAAPEDRSRISYATVAMEGAKHTLNGELSGALGLVMGFNALDGD